MAAFDDLRNLALALPGAYEDTHRGGAAFRVGGKKFALYWAQGGRTIMKLSPGHQHFLFEVCPETFAPCRVGLVNWSFVELGNLDVAELRELTIEAWSTLVTKKVSQTFMEMALSDEA